MTTWRRRLAAWIAGPPAAAGRAYIGAEASRLLGGFADGTMSADQANDGSLRTLRDRGRQLVRDNPLAQAFVRLAADNIVGPDGFGLAVTSRDRTVADAVKAAFYAWCAPDACTVDGRLSFSDVERLVVENWRAADGEALVRLWRGRGPFGLQLQVLDPDLLDETYSRGAVSGGNEIRQGVEIDAFGRPVAYHLWSGHPTEHAGRTRVRVPASDILHIYRPSRPGQTRGVSAFAPVMRELYQLAGMQYATLVGQKVAAQQVTYLIQTDELATPILPDAAGRQVAVLSSEPAATNVIPFGWDAKSVTPAIPQNTYADFHRLTVHHIAVGLGTTYASLMADAADANYSSMRTMSLRERRMWRADQVVVRAAFHERLFRVWLEQAVLSGAVRLRGAPLASVVAEWLPTQWEWVDPMKDAQAAALEVAMGLNSLSNVAAERGRDLDVILRQRADEIARAEAAGVPLHLPLTYVPMGDEAERPTPAPSAAEDRARLTLARAAGGHR